MFAHVKGHVVCKLSLLFVCEQEGYIREHNDKLIEEEKQRMGGKAEMRGG